MISSYKSMWISFSLIAIATTWIGAQTSWDRGLNQLQKQSNQRLDSFVGHLDAQLAQVDFIPELLAGDTQISEFLRQPSHPARTDLMNRYLEKINQISGTSDVYLMDRSGLTLAASNWQSNNPFVGKKFHFRPYFQQAMQGKHGRYFALGTTSKVRGYYFSYPIRYAAEIIGVVVLKMSLADIETRWLDNSDKFIASDNDGIVFISTVPEWRYRSIQTLNNLDLTRVKNSQRYPSIDIEPLSIDPIDSSSTHTLLRIAPGDNVRKISYLSLTKDMPHAGWQVRILSPTQTVRDHMFDMAFMLSLVFLFIGTLLYMQVLRIRKRQEHDMLQAKNKHQLERRVEQRTKELTHEIDERKRTENTLRETQSELIQAAKLAVLGQLSASISHELNNPLAAIRSYADNAREFLQRKQSTQVDSNLARIANLTERMATISSQLKLFARKAEGQLKPLAINSIVSQSIEIVRPQAHQNSTLIDNQCAENTTQVMADPVQIQQVLVNLLSNALFAVAEQADRTITIHSEVGDDYSRIHIDDTGLGINEENLAHIFEPFFTTRKTGLGLGLSISQEIMKDMNSRIEACNITPHGARFTLIMPTEKTA